MKIVEYLTELAINKTPINLGSLINSVHLFKKPKKYGLCKHNENKIGWIDFHDEDNNNIIYTLYFLISDKKDLNWDINDTVYIIELTCGRLRHLYYFNKYYIEYDDFGKKSTKDDTIIVNERIDI